jgi:hypothetical protein
MNHKEEAKRIIKQYDKILKGETNFSSHYFTNHCAKIDVQNTIDALNNLNNYINFDNRHTRESIGDYKQILKEIQKL